MLQVKFEVSRQVENLSQKLKQSIFTFLDELTRFALEEMRRRAPERTGKLRGSIKRRLSLARLEGEIAPTVPYAVYVEYGTRAHMIRPVRASALRFEVEGEVVFAKLVRHPGTKPQPFVRETAEEVERQVPSIWNKVWG